VSANCKIGVIITEEEHNALLEILVAEEDRCVQRASTENRLADKQHYAEQAAATFRLRQRLATGMSSTTESQTEIIYNKIEGQENQPT